MTDLFLVEATLRLHGRWQSFFPEMSPDEMSFDAIVNDILGGQYHARRVFKLEGAATKLGSGVWRDITAEVASECLLRLDRRREDIPDFLRDFLEQHLGSLRSVA